MIGTTLDKYQVLQKVGEGGMATVYRGRHCTLDRQVAIKVLHPHLSSSVRNRTRFAREVEAIERLRHENILEIFDYSGNEGSDCYLVTEFVDGETLTELIERRGRLPSEVVAQIGAALCKALGYAHTAGVLHRDVKTDNVMVRTDGTVKLMDFGIARFLDETRVTMTGALVGSPAFMSPEQAMEAPLDQRSDLFALGTVLFYLVTGHLPFTGGNPSLILKNVIEGNRPHVVELAPAMSATLSDVIERLMATNPADRYTVASDVAAHLAGCLTESRLDPQAPEWSLAAWMHDPDEYEQRLDAHLKTVLVEEGRRLLSVGDHLTALRLLNRLLSMDENNPEVLSLVQGLHGEPPIAGTRRTRTLAGGALMALALAVAGLSAAAWLSDPGADGETGEVVAAPAPAPPSDLRSEATAARAVEAEPEPRHAVAPPPPPAPELDRERRTSAEERRRVERAVEPTPTPRPEPQPAPEVLPPGMVRLNTGNYVAEVFLRGTRIKLGDTRSDLPLSAGTHELELRSPVLQEHVQKVTVASGERLVIPVTLRPRPARVNFPKTWPGECQVRHDGAPAGSLAGLGWSFTVERPDQEHTVELKCPDGRAVSEHWNNLPATEVTFSP